MKINKLVWLLLTILIVPVAILGIMIAYRQTKASMVHTFTDELVESKENLQKNYILNVRLVDNGTECNEKESVAAGEITHEKKQYKLQYIALENELQQKQIFQICQEIHFNYSFVSLYKQKESQEKEDTKYCDYQGIRIKPQENTDLCPISSVIISEEDAILNYEKISISNNTKYNLFVKRSDAESTPLVGVDLILDGDDSTKFLQQKSKVTYTMQDICKDKYMQYEGLCQFESNPEQIKLSFVLENQIPLNSQCTTFDLLSFKQTNILLYGKSFNKIQFGVGAIVIAINIIICVVMLFINFESEAHNHTLVQYSNFSFVNLVYFSILLHDFHIIKNVIETTCYVKDNFLEHIYQQTEELCYLLTIFIAAQVVLILIPYVIGLYERINKSDPNKFIRIEESHEMSMTL